MNEIEQYRKDSADWMGLEYVGQWKWKPDQDHNQMAMMEDKLIEEGCETYCSIHRTSLTKTVQYDYRIVNDKTDNRAINISQESKCIAFMKAWSEYYKQTKGL